VEAVQTVKATQTVPVSQLNNYLNIHNIIATQISTKEGFYNMTVFTPGSRLVLTLDEASQLIAHRKAWTDIMNSATPLGIIFENYADLTDINLQFRLENLELPKDWDIVVISDSQYALNKRAAKILYEATLQYHAPVKSLIKSISILKVIQIAPK